MDKTISLKNSKLAITVFVLIAFFCFGGSGLAQVKLNERQEILRHFDEGDKLFSHKYQRSDTVRWGYFFGHSRFWDYEFAEKYQIEGKAYVIGIIAHIKGSNATEKKAAHFSVYNVHKDMKPDKAMYTKNLTYEDLNIDGTATTVMLDSAVLVADSFFVSFGVADYVHFEEVWGEDTLHLLATEDGSRDEEDLKVFGRNCIRTHSVVPELAWIDVYSGGWNPMNAYLAIFPIMDFSYGTNNVFVDHGGIRLYKSYFNSSSNKIEVVLSSRLTTRMSFKLVGIAGKELLTYSQDIEGGGGKVKIPINLSTPVSKGNYILLVSGGGSTIGQKISIR